MRDEMTLTARDMALYTAMYLNRDMVVVAAHELAHAWGCQIAVVVQGQLSTGEPLYGLFDLDHDGDDDQVRRGAVEVVG